MRKIAKKIEVPYILLFVAGITVGCLAFFMSLNKKTVTFDVKPQNVEYMTVSGYSILHGKTKKITDQTMISRLLEEAKEEPFYYWGSKEKRLNQHQVEKSSSNLCFSFYDENDQCIGKILKDEVCGGYVTEKSDGYYIFSGEEEELKEAAGTIIKTLK